MIKGKKYPCVSTNTPVCPAPYLPSAPHRPPARRVLLPTPLLTPPPLSTAHRDTDKYLPRSSLSKSSLLGSPPSMLRIPGSPQPLSVYFCNMHGRPQTLKRRYIPKNSRSHKTPVSAITSHERTQPHAVANQSSAVPTPSTEISEMITDIIENAISEAKACNHANEQPLSESRSSLDNSTITNVFGDPSLDSLSPSKSSSQTSSNMSLN